MEEYAIQINDCFVSIVGVVPSEEEIESIYNELPVRIKHLAAEWGWFDTEVGDKIYVWLEEKYNKGK